MLKDRLFTCLAHQFPADLDLIAEDVLGPRALLGSPFYREATGAIIQQLSLAAYCVGTALWIAGIVGPHAPRIAAGKLQRPFSAGKITALGKTQFNSCQVLNLCVVEELSDC